MFAGEVAHILLAGPPAKAFVSHVADIPLRHSRSIKSQICGGLKCARKEGASRSIGGGAHLEAFDAFASLTHGLFRPVLRHVHLQTLSPFYSIMNYEPCSLYMHCTVQNAAKRGKSANV